MLSQNELWIIGQYVLSFFKKKGLTKDQINWLCSDTPLRGYYFEMTLHETLKLLASQDALYKI